ncbi:MAG: phosphoribosylglycinamide formyltransferase [Coraliomargaritaceae bacterium]
MSFKIVILGSGRGSNAKAILEAEATGQLGEASTVAILSDKKEAPILDLAKQFGKSAHSIPCNPKKARLNPEETEAFLKIIQELNPDLVVLAGFMKIIDPQFIESLDGKIINLHPSLLPSFPGINSIESAFNFPVKITGCTVHWVIPKIDAGKIIDQKAVIIEPNDTLESLSEKVHSAEHLLLPDVICRLSTRAIPFSK